MVKGAKPAATKAASPAKDKKPATKKAKKEGPKPRASLSEGPQNVCALSYVLVPGPTSILSLRGLSVPGKVHVRRYALQARGLTSFLFFTKENREAIMKKHGLESKNIGDISKKMGEEWKSMSVRGHPMPHPCNPVRRTFASPNSWVCLILRKSFHCMNVLGAFSSLTKMTCQ
jgi:hypothetical protein